MAGITKIIQLSDTHIVPEGALAYGVVDTGAYLAQAVLALNGLLEFIGPIDAMVVTGDLTDFGAAEEYQRFQALIAPLKFPVVAVPGNHDRREAMRAALGFENRSGPLNTHARFGPVHVLALDSLVSGKPFGMLDDETLGWLSEKLAGIQGEPVIAALHHPPFDTSIGHMDRQRLRNADQLLDIMAGHTGPKQIICGHVHRYITHFDARCPAMIAPAPAHAVALDHRADGPSNFTLDPGGVLLHTCVSGPGGASFTSEFVPVGACEGPYSFGL